MIRPVARSKLNWQSKFVLLAVMPYTTISVIFQARAWALYAPSVTVWTLGLGFVLGFVAWKTHSATPVGSATGATIAISVMFSTLVFPYRLWQTALIPVLAVLILTSAATQFGRRRKELLGTAEKRAGRGGTQVAANLGMAALLFEPTLRTWIVNTHWFALGHLRAGTALVFGLAALAEAAADTISSEIGLVLGGQPRMITTLRKAETGADGAISFRGTVAGILAAGSVAAAGTWAFGGEPGMFGSSWAGGVFGLIFDSLLGATLERRGWLNNDAVNFLSTASAAGAATVILAWMPGVAAG